MENWSAKHLYLPLRRDLLHLAVVYEGDSHRQGTASSKTRYEVHGSHRKMRPQKGTGRSRMGTKQSPLLRGGGKTFGPKPRDFSTKLDKKVYDKAWRTALSYRYRRGQLIVCEDGMELPLPKDFTQLAEGGFMEQVLVDGYLKKWARQMVETHGWGSEFGRTLFVTADKRKGLFEAMEQAGQDGRALEVADVDVKDLLETGRLVVERAALREMVELHQSDLITRIVVNGLRDKGPPIGEKVI
jgi:large subunit ribosomal protein L4